MKELSGSTLITVGVVLELLNIITIFSGQHSKMEADLPVEMRSSYMAGVYLFQGFLIIIGLVLIIKGVRRRRMRRLA